VSANDLLFYNSFKMKLSVIMGILQMLTGTVLKGFNAIHTREYLDFMFEVVPMLVFAVSLFGYMILLILTKWTINWDERMGLATDADGNPQECPLQYGGVGQGCQPPSLINTLMEIALKPGYCSEPMFPGQAGLQSFLLSCALIAVPVLLLAKPMCLKWREDAKKKGKRYSALDSHKDDHEEEDDLTGDDHGGGGHGHGPFNFAELMIHQMIETIEFVLGMVSNTASYLRLWALSLAHSELALVFWEKVGRYEKIDDEYMLDIVGGECKIRYPILFLLFAQSRGNSRFSPTTMLPAQIFISGLETGNPIAIFVAYAIWMAVTFAVLLCMDVLECFLHALRLHWVSILTLSTWTAQNSTYS
jgi:V-type H+-transporting ATPase subunit a